MRRRFCGGTDEDEELEELDILMIVNKTK